MFHPTIASLLDRATAGYATALRPSVASLHRVLRSDVMHRNDERRAEGLASLACPGIATLRRRIGLLDAGQFSAARHGRTASRLREGTTAARAVGRGRSVPSEATIGRLRGTVGLLVGVIEAGGDASDLARASMLLAAQDRLALVGDVDPLTLQDLHRSIDHVLLCVARTAAATPDDLRLRVQLFGRRQEHGDDLVGVTLANSVERDRRRLRLSLADVA